LSEHQSSAYVKMGDDD